MKTIKIEVTVKVEDETWNHVEYWLREYNIECQLLTVSRLIHERKELLALKMEEVQV